MFIKIFKCSKGCDFFPEFPVYPNPTSIPPALCYTDDVNELQLHRHLLNVQAQHMRVQRQRKRERAYLNTKATAIIRSLLGYSVAFSAFRTATERKVARAHVDASSFIIIKPDMHTSIIIISSKEKINFKFA